MNPAAAQRLVFAGRTTVAALLAAYVAFMTHLPQASTSMITVFIVSQPLAGMVLSKSVFRIAGTALGAVVAVLLTSALSSAPELFAFAVAAWIGACVMVSVYMRDAPAGYAALLSGYTVAIVAFPSVEAPEGVFQAALDRGAEITVGILCATALSQTVFPRSAAETLRKTTASAIDAASAWAVDTLRGRPDPEKTRSDRRALVAKVAALDTLRVHAAFDSDEIRRSGRRLRLLHGRIVSALALIVSIHDRLEIARAEFPDLLDRISPALDRAGEAMSANATIEDRSAARRALAAALPDLDALKADRSRLLERAILLRVADLVEVREDLDAASFAATPQDGSAPAGVIARYRDHELAIVSGLLAFVGLLSLSAFWIASGWNGGAGAAIMTAVMMSLFAQQDDPSAAAGSFFVMTLLGSVVAAIYLFAVLPGLEGFETLALALAPALFAAAWAMGDPRLTLRGLAFALGMLNAMSLTNVMTPDFARFANGALAQLVGIAFAAALLAALRPIGAAWPVARLTAGLRSDLASAIAGRTPPGRLAFESRILDRVDGLMRRLDLNDPDQLALEQGALASVRVGLNAVALRRVVRDLPSEVAAPLADALAETARHLRRLARGKTSAPPIARLDAALEAALGPSLAERPDAADVATQIAALRGGMERHPRMFGASPEPEAAR